MAEIEKTKILEKTPRWINFQTIIFVFGLLFIVIGGIITTLYSRNEAEKKERNDLIKISDVAVAAINPRRLSTLKGSDEDLENPDYQRLKEQLILIDEALKNFGTKWIYLMKKENGNWFFSVDPLNVDSPDYTPPGTPYENYPKELNLALSEKKTISVGPYSDQWGEFVSAFSPVKDLETGEVLGVLGVDIETSIWHLNIWKSQLLPILISFFVLALWILFFIYRNKKAKHEKEIRAREERFKSIAEALNDIIFRIDLDGKITYVSVTVENLTGFPPETMIGDNFLDLFLVSEHTKALRAFQGVLQGENIDSFEIFVKCKNRESMKADFNIDPIYEAGKLLEIQGVLHDITQWKNNEERIIKQAKELKESQAAVLNVLEDVEQEKNKSENLANDLEKFKLAVDNTSNHIVITDAEGIALYANKAVEEITGFQISEVVGKKAGNKDLWGGQMEKSDYEKMWKTIKVDKKTFIGELNNQRKNGEKYVALANISPVLDEKGQVKFFVGIERDITKEKEVDKAKTEFVSLASHQLRTPLSAINWYTEMLLAGDAGKINKEQKNFLNEIYNGNKRMVDLVNALLNVSRIDLGTFAIEPKPTNLKEITDMVVAELLPDSKAKKIKIENKYDESIPILNIDPNLTKIIFQNLLSNAVKYTPEKGSITLLTKKQEKDILVTVTDTGYGIPEAAQAKIFTKLYRADNAREKDANGTGLGLYLVKAIVESSGGKIWFESIENKGTTFSVTLPLSGMKEKAGSKGITMTA